MSYYNTPDLPFTTTTISGQTRLRIDESGFGAQLPRTVMEVSPSSLSNEQSFRIMVEKHRDLAALISCKDEVFTFKQYYDECCWYIFT